MDNTTTPKKNIKNLISTILIGILLIALFVFIGIPLLQNEFTVQIWQRPSEALIYEYDGVYTLEDDNGVEWSGTASIVLSPDRELIFDGIVKNNAGDQRTWTDTYRIKGEYGTKLFWADWWITKSGLTSIFSIRPAKEDGAKFFMASLIPEDGGKEKKVPMWYSDSVLYMDDDRFVRVS